MDEAMRLCFSIYLMSIVLLIGIALARFESYFYFLCILLGFSIHISFIITRYSLQKRGGQN